RGSRLPAVSIAWGAWEGSGMVARVDERARREWTARGVGTLSPEQGLRLLEGAIRAGRARVAAIPMDSARYLGALVADGVPPLLRGMGRSGATGSARPQAAPTGDAARDGSLSASVVGHSVAGGIAALPVRERLVALTGRLRRETAAVMGIQHPEDL